jgi:hypothetical protein
VQSGFSADVQAYILALFFGTAAPLLVFWMLHLPLRSFLAEIFQSPAVEQFWIRLVIVVLVCSGLSSTVGYRPSGLVTLDFVALIWNLGEQFQSILYGILFSLFGLFLPLLLAYTILHAGRHRANAVERKGP